MRSTIPGPWCEAGPHARRRVPRPLAALSDDRSPDRRPAHRRRALVDRRPGARHAEPRRLSRLGAAVSCARNSTRLGWDAKPGESPLDADAARRADLASSAPSAARRSSVRRARASPPTCTIRPRCPAICAGRSSPSSGHDADAVTWEQLHAAARKEDSFEQKRSLYSALVSRAQSRARRANAGAFAHRRTHRPRRRPPRPARGARWRATRARLDFRPRASRRAPRQAPGLRRQPLRPRHLRGLRRCRPRRRTRGLRAKESSACRRPAVAKAADNIRFQAEFKARVLPEIDAWWQARVRR